MKAIFFEKHGEIEVLKYADLPDPKPAPGEALIKVKAVALNHLDIWVRKGWRGLSLDFPHIGGSDISGEIVKTNGGGNFEIGAKVIINPGLVTLEDEFTRRGEDSISPGYKIIGEQLRGGMAQYVCVPQQNVFRMPEGVSFSEAAAPILVGTTAWRMLFKQAKLQPGETVLVVGSGGGVNTISIQLAKAIGAYVYVLAGNDIKAGRAEHLGAHEVINYTKTPQWQSEILKRTKGRGVDVVIDNVGEATLSKSLTAVRRGGRIVSVGNTSGYNIHYDNRMLFAKQVSLIGSTMGSRQDFIDSQAFLKSQNIKIPIDKTAPLSEGVTLIKYLEDGRQFGKIVLEL